MFRLDHKKGQAALELAVFGAILIFLLGTIVRTAAGNSYTQDQNFKAMRMALLSSWQGSEATNMSHNSAAVLIVEDRLSPDLTKYGDLDRNPYIASGSGTFTYQLLYPLAPFEVGSNLPMMDVYVNGQHFPLTEASYFPGKAVPGPAVDCSSLSGCYLNQCLRNKREWVGGGIKESQFEYILPVTPVTATLCAQIPPGLTQKICQEESNANEIFLLLQNAGLISGNVIPSLTAQSNVISLSAALRATAVATFKATFDDWYEGVFPYGTTADTKAMTAAQNKVLSVLSKAGPKYKLFYSLVANPGGSPALAGPAFRTVPPTPSCSSPPCQDQALTADLPLYDYNDNPTNDGFGNTTNVNGVMQYDLLRMANYPQVMASFPTPNTAITPPTTCTACMRNYVAWQWSATAGTSAAMIGLNTTNNQYPNYDIDGRLKEVTIYTFSWNGTTASVGYEDMQAGDIDETWDTSTCTPKPGLQNDSQIYTFTQDGTYLQINEGKLYNTETGTVVRSANKRDNVDLIQRVIQLSNNTGRFCSQNAKGVEPTVCPSGGSLNGIKCANPNAVEVCLDSSIQGGLNCNTSTPNFKETCYDTSDNKLFVRSRLQDLRGRFWKTNASGQLQVQ